jgi:hypothetical protein
MKIVRECKASIRLDLDTQISGPEAALSPISMLEGAVEMPRCGSRRVVLLFDLPSSPLAKRARQPEGTEVALAR